jgi:hypothetical protein
MKHPSQPGGERMGAKDYVHFGVITSSTCKNKK